MFREFSQELGGTDTSDDHNCNNMPKQLLRGDKNHSEEHDESLQKPSANHSRSSTCRKWVQPSMRNEYCSFNDIITLFIQDQHLFNNRVKNKISALQMGLTEMKSLLDNINRNTDGSCTCKSNNRRNQWNRLQSDGVRSMSEKLKKVHFNQRILQTELQTSTLVGSTYDKSSAQRYQTNSINSVDHGRSLHYTASGYNTLPPYHQCLQLATRR